MRCSSVGFILLVFSLYQVVTGCITGENCDTCSPSLPGNWGDNCNSTCPKNCYSGCDRSRGVCDIGCKDGFYDQNCSSTCPFGCQTGCNQTSGHCFRCVKGLHGSKCDNNCSEGCNGACELETGICLECKPGLSGPFCNSQCQCGCEASCLCADRPKCAANKGTQLLTNYWLICAMVLIQFSTLFSKNHHGGTRAY